METYLTGWKGIPQSYECTEFLDFAPQLLANFRIAQSFQERRGAARVVPRVDERPESESVSYVRINIRRHVHAFGAGLPDQVDRLLHQGPVLFAGGLQVINVHRNFGAAAYLQRFADSLQHFRALIAHVSGIEAAILRHHLAHLH